MPHKHTQAAQWATWDFSQVKQTAGHNQKHKKKYGKKQKTKESQISSCATVRHERGEYGAPMELLAGCCYDLMWPTRVAVEKDALEGKLQHILTILSFFSGA